MSSELTRRDILGDAALVGVASAIGIQNVLASQASTVANPPRERRTSFDDGWSFAGGYDSLNRVTNAEAGLGPYQGLRMSWSYDSFGNRTAETFAGTTGALVPTSTTAQYNANNQVLIGTDIPYDLAGNLTYDSANQYLYDANGRVCAVQDRYYGDMTGYLYNAEGQRVAKGTLTAFSCNMTPDPTTGIPANGFVLTRESVLGQGGEQLAELARDESGRKAFAGRALALVQSNGRPGEMQLTASSASLTGASVTIAAQPILYSMQPL